MSKSTTPGTAPLDLFGIDALLDDEELAIRDTVRRYCDDRIRPHIAEWFEAAQIPARELSKELGALGLLGMHLQGYGCAGTSSRHASPYAVALVPAQP